MLLLAEYKRSAYFKKDFLAVAANEFVVLFLWFFLWPNWICWILPGFC